MRDLSLTFYPSFHSIPTTYQDMMKFALPIKPICESADLRYLKSTNLQHRRKTFSLEPETKMQIKYLGACLYRGIMQRLDVKCQG